MRHHFLTKRQAQVLELRQLHTQEEIAQRFGTSQANISHQEKAARLKIVDAVEFLETWSTREIMMNLSISPIVFDNALRLFPFIRLPFCLTGISAQWLLCGYYYRGDVVYIRTSSPAFKSMKGVNIISRKVPNLLTIVNGIPIAPLETVIADCIEIGNSGAIKSVVALLIMNSQMIDVSKIIKDLEEENKHISVLFQILNSLDRLGYALDYQKESATIGALPTGTSPEIPFIIEKVYDDLEPFIADDTT